MSSFSPLVTHLKEELTSHLSKAFKKREGIPSRASSDPSTDREGVKKSSEWALESWAIETGVQSTTRYRKANAASRHRRAGSKSPARVSSGRKGGITASKTRAAARATTSYSSSHTPAASFSLATFSYDGGGSGSGSGSGSSSSSDGTGYGFATPPPPPMVKQEEMSPAIKCESPSPSMAKYELGIKEPATPQTVGGSSLDFTLPIFRAGAYDSMSGATIGYSYSFDPTADAYNGTPLPVVEPLFAGDDSVDQVGYFSRPWDEREDRFHY